MKPGQRTTEFLIITGVIVGEVATALEGALSPSHAAIAVSVAAAAYAVSRGLAKIGKTGA